MLFRVCSGPSSVRCYCYFIMNIQFRRTVLWRSMSSCSASCSEAHPSEGTASLKIPSEFLPSKNFIERLKYDYEKDKLAKLLAEMELIVEMDFSIPCKLSDKHWEFYFHLRNIEERADYLRQLYSDEIGVQKHAKLQAQEAVERQKMSESQITRFNNGEIVYAQPYHSLLEIRGKVYRKMLDRLYGSRLLSAQRCGESLPRIVVDCRYLIELNDIRQAKFIRWLQRLHESNWLSSHPFPISFANFIVDDPLARHIKRSLYFLTGPPRLKESIAEDDVSCVYDQIDADNLSDGNCLYEPHPLIPVISSRPIRESLIDISDNEVVYISSNATKTLDGPVGQYKAFILCANDDNVAWQSSLSAARIDKFNAAQIPLDRHVKWETGSKSMPLEITANILRSVLLNGNNWKSAIFEHVPKYNLLKPAKLSNEEERRAANVLRKQKIQALKETMAEIYDRRLDATSHTREHERIPKDAVRPRRTHRYSREERRAMREIRSCGSDGTRESCQL